MPELHLYPENNNRPQIPVLILHGVTASPDEVLPLAEALVKQGHEILVPVLPGHETNVEDLRQTRAAQWLDTAREAALRLGAAHSAIAVVGQSFGGILALHVAEIFPQTIRSVTALATPLRFRSPAWEQFFNIISFLPEPILNLLGTRNKVPKDLTRYRFPYLSYSAHSYGAIARIAAIRRRIIKEGSRIRAPILVLNDPEDSHLSPQCPALFKSIFSSTSIESLSVDGGLHQLLLGQKSDYVIEKVVNFIEQTAIEK